MGKDMRLTGSAMKGKSRAAGVTAAKRSVVVSFPRGYAFNRTSVKKK